MKKAAAAISLILVLMSCLILPTVAASNGWTEVDVTFDNVLYRFYYSTEVLDPKPITGTVVGSSLQWTLVGSGRMNAAVRMTDEIFSVENGDVVTIPSIPAGGFSGWFGGGSNNNATVYFALYACDANGVPLADSSGGPVLLAPVELWGTLVGGNNWSYNYNPTNGITLKVNKASQYAFLGFNLQFTAPNDFNFSMNNTAPFTIGYGNPNSPERPKYDPPSSGSINNYVDADKELMDKNQAGLNTAVDIFDSFSLLDISSGLTALIAIYGEILPRLGWLNRLISISLALGLFAFIVNIVPSVFNKFVQPKEKGGGSKSKKGG